MSVLRQDTHRRGLFPCRPAAILVLEILHQLLPYLPLFCLRLLLSCVQASALLLDKINLSSSKIVLFLFSLSAVKSLTKEPIQPSKISGRVSLLSNEQRGGGMYEKIIEAGLIFLLIYTPLAFGGVSPRATTVMEIVIGGLLLVWLTKMLAARRQQQAHSHVLTRQNSALQLVVPSVALLLGLFMLLVVLQRVPLPRWLVHLVSPSTFRAYNEAARLTDSALPAWLPLTIRSQATDQALAVLWAYGAVFLLILNNLRSPRQMKRLVYIMIAVGVGESLYGLLEYLSGHHHIYFYPKQSSFSVSGTFVNRNHFAGYMAMVIPLTFGVLFVRLEDRSQTVTRRLVRFFDEKYMKAVLIGFLVLVMVGAELLSGSRGGVVSFACGMLTLLVLGYRRRLLRKKTVIVLLLLLVAAGGAVFAGHDLIVSRLHTLTQLESEVSFQLRQEFWRSALAIFSDFPMLGSGLGTFPHLFPRYQTFRSDLRVLYAESDYLQLLAETGVIGFGCVLGMGVLFFATTFRAWRRRRSRWSVVMGVSGMSAIVSILVHSGVDFNLHIPANALVFTMIAALSMVAAQSHRRSPR
ncbi:hypothetical protein GF339_11720 [candidate division KSB3 bacterium]|uniref:O-antigen ligase-related domain-containing protein n=1 Tax=candidate division KSB3 bacterium TaxID=2044937 RepID=A0A9D5Q6T7_9BACT|nr:hypothetical protein [candidate division KSB3 bacterium]MBD3325246.1 hypothetical protein [candidate division KSB3 bacterium]